MQKQIEIGNAAAKNNYGEGGGDIAARDARISKIVAALQARIEQAKLGGDEGKEWVAYIRRGSAKKPYLVAEAWQYIAAIQGLAIAPHGQDAIQRIVEDGRTVGWQVTMRVFDPSSPDITLSAGTATCDYHETVTHGKANAERLALMTAQTWAVSRAVRNSSAFIATLAGYEATPAEEMDADDDKQPPNDQPQWLAGNAAFESQPLGDPKYHGPCTTCGARSVVKHGIKGVFLGCSTFPSCRGSGKVLEPPSDQPSDPVAMLSDAEIEAESTDYQAKWNG